MTIDTIGSATQARPVDRPAAAVGDASAQTARAPATAVETAAAVKGPANVPTLDQVHHAVSQLNKSAQAKSQGLEIIHEFLSFFRRDFFGEIFFYNRHF